MKAHTVFMVQRSKSSPAWMHEHVNDPYVQRAQKDGYRARAAYKLLEINEKDITELASSLVETITKFYENPQNEKEYKKWLKEREKV